MKGNDLIIKVICLKKYWYMNKPKNCHAKWETYLERMLYIYCTPKTYYWLLFPHCKEHNCSMFWGYIIVVYHFQQFLILHGNFFVTFVWLWLVCIKHTKVMIYGKLVLCCLLSIKIHNNPCYELATSIFKETAGILLIRHL